MGEWKKVRIGEICKIEKGNIGIARATPGEYPLVVTAVERKTCDTYQFDCEAICIPLVSSSGHGKKSLNNVHFQSGKFALGTILCAVIPNNSDEVSASFLHQYLQFYKDRVLVPLMKGVANVSLSMHDIANIEIPIPPIAKQNKLAQLLVSVQEKQKEIAIEFERQAKYAKLLRRNILQDAIEGKLTADWRKEHPVQKGNPDYDAEALFELIQKERKVDKKRKTLPPILDVEKPFELPTGWKWVRLGEIANVVRGGSPRPAGDKAYYDGNIPFLKVADLTATEDKELYAYTYTIKEAGLYKTRFVEKETLMLTNSGATLGVPKICMIATTFNDGIAAFLGIKQRILKDYMFYLLKSKTQWFLKEAARGQGQPNLNSDIIANTIATFPPLKEQEVIVNQIENLLSKATELETQIKERERLSERLISGIIRGNLEEGE